MKVDVLSKSPAATKRQFLKRNNMIDHIILTVSDIDRSLTFYEESLAPLNIRYFMPFG
jgi:catechol-2,3-dioxygenase